MTRSPDDIFAAQLWYWPDPALKRDAYGRVLFVNAAFLQLFGGQIEHWQGQTVDGWHIPQAGSGLNRFEIRIPANGGQPEQIYDWVEQTDQAGNAFALARNVTELLPAVQDTPPRASMPDFAAHQSAPQAEAPLAQAEPIQPDPGPAPQPEPAPSALTPSAPTSAALNPADTGPAAATPAANHPATTQQSVSPLDFAAGLGTSPMAAAPEAEPTSAFEPASAPVAAPASAPAPAPVEATPAETEPVRDFERRALPIENDDAVFGNNWRDAVIAKAVGVQDDPEPADAAAAAQTPSDIPAGDSIHILLAEDNAINALLTRTLLEAEGHTVETVEDGQLAVDAMKTQSFDLIFMDMRMPNMDGLEATRNIRRLPNVPSDLPIIALTANAFDDDRNACFDSGMNDFMTKPVSAEELSEMVTRWTTQNKQNEQKMAS